MGIGDKAQSTPRLELVHRAHQPQIPLLNQVEKRHPTVAEARCHMNDETQVRLHHLRFGLVKLPLGARPGSGNSLQGLGPLVATAERPLKPHASPHGHGDATAVLRRSSARYATG